MINCLTSFRMVFNWLDTMKAAITQFLVGLFWAASSLLHGMELGAGEPDKEKKVTSMPILVTTYSWFIPPFSFPFPVHLESYCHLSPQVGFFCLGSFLG